MNVLLRYCRLIYVFTYLLYLSFNSYLLIYSFSGIPDWKESAQYERLMKKKKKKNHPGLGFLFLVILFCELRVQHYVT